jgi:glutamate racemase
VEQRPCPLFVPLVEEGWFEHPAAELIAHEYLEPLRQARVDTLVLGCTHYPLLKPLLQRVMGPDVRLIDSGEETAAVVGHVLDRNGLRAPEDASAEHRFAVSDDEARFRHVGARFIGERLGRAEVVPLD